jgi:hypothetical protein
MPRFQAGVSSRNNDRTNADLLRFSDASHVDRSVGAGAVARVYRTTCPPLGGADATPRPYAGPRRQPFLGRAPSNADRSPITVVVNWPGATDTQMYSSTSSACHTPLQWRRMARLARPDRPTIILQPAISAAGIPIRNRTTA